MSEIIVNTQAEFDAFPDDEMTEDEAAELEEAANHAEDHESTPEAKR